MNVDAGYSVQITRCGVSQVLSQMPPNYDRIERVQISVSYHPANDARAVLVRISAEIDSRFGTSIQPTAFRFKRLVFRGKPHIPLHYVSRLGESKDSASH